jgi:hypothetical protein
VFIVAEHVWVSLAGFGKAVPFLWAYTGLHLHVYYKTTWLFKGKNAMARSIRIVKKNKICSFFYNILSETPSICNYINIFRDFKPCSLVHRYQGFRGTWCLHIRSRNCHNTYIPNYTASHSWIPLSEHSPSCHIFILRVPARLVATLNVSTRAE